MSRLFPELDGGTAAPRPAAPKTPETARTTGAQATRAQAAHVQPVAPSPARGPSGGSGGGAGGGSGGGSKATRACVLGGLATMQRFDTLFGLPGPFMADGGCHVVAVRAFREGDLSVEIVGGGVPRTTVTLTPRDQGERFASTEHFTLGYLAHEASPALQGLLRRAVHRLAKVTLPQLAKVLLMDPAKRVERGKAAGGSNGAGGPDVQVGPDEHGNAHDMLHSLVQVYGSSEAWCNFFADKEQQRNFCHNVSGSIVMIGHEDLECHYATPPTNDGSIGFFNYSRLHDRYTPGSEDQAQAHVGVRPTDGSAPHEHMDPAYLISDLHDLDVIKGGAKKLDRALDSILEHKTPPEMVVVRATCVPIVIGDDMEGSVERFKKKSKLPVVYLDNIADQHASPFRDVFRKVKDAPDFKRPEKVAGSINLLGYPSEAEMASLLDALKRLSITVNCRILPEIDVNVMKRYTRAELAVLFDCSLYDSDYKEIVGDIELGQIRPPPPYGVRNSERWLRDIATALGRPAELVDAVWAESMAGFQQQWAPLAKQVAGYRLGFVVDEERIPLLREPRRWLGIPIVDVLCEMGFELDFLVYVDPRTNPGAGASAKSAASMVGDLGGAGTRVVGFSTPAELESALRASDAQAFYSDVYFDRRLTRCGKNQFSVKAFRIGLPGVLEMARQLLAVCRMPFYRRYAGYMGQAFHA